MGKSDWTKESSNCESLNQRSLKFQYYNYLWHALQLSYSSFRRGQNQTGDLPEEATVCMLSFAIQKFLPLLLKEIHYTLQNLNDIWRFLQPANPLEYFLNKKSPRRPSFHFHIFATTHFTKCFTITPYP